MEKIDIFNPDTKTNNSVSWTILGQGMVGFFKTHPDRINGMKHICSMQFPITNRFGNNVPTPMIEFISEAISLYISNGDMSDVEELLTEKEEEEIGQQ